MNIKGKNVLITGASSGIGEAAARETARRGGIPLLVARREEELARVAREIQTESGIKAAFLVCDVSSPLDRIKIEPFARSAGGVSILINNAGITAHGRFDQTQPGIAEQAMNLNFFAALYTTQTLLPVMRETAGQKKIVLVSTPSALYGIPGRFAYSASKAAGHAWMESIRIELKREGFDTLIFCPGYTRTQLRTRGLSADGTVLSEEQASGAKDPSQVATILLEAVRKDKRIAFTNSAGPLVYYLRTLAPGFLEKMLAKKLKKDFQT
ncbi:MAG TPA: SDR family NAD(P)-dependent oxidoreductase [Leptospiraceae bacterium]|jgi:short-subunit dehydrogenase|nr:SDR family NAD(P)-dependent oxidoreductase [Leptospirales bacterium]HMU84034.1 SDR family NAD(P)-dependent oxidoreductase [Leptospiraceae bacterium]HMX55541.1 SDR family NAD(P)-dependent oxidoreductase [Leptospiraceae bacterium]HMY45634.1 SDR family NAD(P)-dependent oxidoreductase [Leptospiraceae bacterium]HMZ37378.1 SDR family NAD(P)-dependent oxidoreductase [Leptospiraceae bacterium]